MEAGDIGSIVFITLVVALMLVGFINDNVWR